MTSGPRQPHPALVITRFLAGAPVLALTGITNAQCDRWDPLASRSINATHAQVSALASWDPDGAGSMTPRLIAAGTFTVIGGQKASRIAMWDGEAWEPLSAGLDDWVGALTTWDADGDGPLPPRLIAAGRFLHAGGVAAARIAIWDGAEWRPLGSGASSIVASVCVWDSDGTGPALPLLVAAGAFNSAGGTPANRVAAWDGTSWQTLGLPFPATPSTVRKVTSWDPDGSGRRHPELVAVGSFRSGGPPFFCSAARRNDTEWAPICCLSCNQGSVYAVASWPGEPHDNLYMAASWPPDDIVRWGGSSVTGFAPLLGGYPAMALTPWDPDAAGPLEPQIVAGGGHAWSTNGTPLNGITRFDGAWRPFGEGMEYTLSLGGLYALCTWDRDGPGPAPDVLVAGGSFGPTEDPAERYLVTAWLIGAPVITSQPDSAQPTPGFDARLTVGASGEDLTYRWRRDGIELSDGPTGHGSIIEGSTTAELIIRAFAGDDAGTYRVLIGNACGETPSAEALLGACLVDFNADGAVDSRDFFSFVPAFFNADARADFNGDGAVTDLDFFAFVEAFLLSCDA